VFDGGETKNKVKPCACHTRTRSIKHFHKFCGLSRTLASLAILRTYGTLWCSWHVSAVLYILRNALPDFEQFPTYHGLRFLLVTVTFSPRFLYDNDLLEVQVTPFLFARVRVRFQICGRSAKRCAPAHPCIGGSAAQQPCFVCCKISASHVASKGLSHTLSNAISHISRCFY
jgi:hypothetical protein